MGPNLIHGDPGRPEVEGVPQNPSTLVPVTEPLQFWPEAIAGQEITKGTSLAWPSV